MNFMNWFMSNSLIAIFLFFLFSIFLKLWKMDTEEIALKMKLFLGLEIITIQTNFSTLCTTHSFKKFMKKIIYSIIKDVKELQILEWRDSFGYSYDDTLMRLLTKYFAWNKSLYILVKSWSEFVAFCSVDIDWYEDDYFFLREILVDKKFQWSQIGSDLIKKALEHARLHGARGIVTETAFDNIPMRKLCEKSWFLEWDNLEWKEGITYKINF